MSRAQDIDFIQQMIVLLIGHIHRVGLSPAIAEHLMDALRAINEDAAYDDPDPAAPGDKDGGRNRRQ